MRRHTALAVAAVAVSLIIAILIGTSGYPDRSKQADSSKDARQNEAVTPDFSAIGNATLSYKDACENPKDANDANLCIQRETLKVYQKQLTWAKLTFLVGVLGTSAVAATLYYTHDAVRSAARSAKAAEEAAHTERAWVLFDNFQGNWSQGTAEVEGVKYAGGYIVTLIFVNAGRSPAVNVNVARDFQITDRASKVPPMFAKPQFIETKSVIGQGKVASANLIYIKQSDMEKVFSHEKRLFVHATVMYFDIFRPDILRRTQFTGEVIISGKMTHSLTRETTDVIYLEPRGDQNGCT